MKNVFAVNGLAPDHVRLQKKCSLPAVPCITVVGDHTIFGLHCNLASASKNSKMLNFSLSEAK